MLAIVPVREGRLCDGGAEAVATAGGRGWLVGQDAAAAASELAGIATTEVCVSEAATFAPGPLAIALAPLVRDESHLVLPGSPDGRDLAPRLAHLLERPLASYAVEVTEERAWILTHDGRLEHEVLLDRPAVVTTQPGAIGVVAADGASPAIRPVELAVQPADGARVEAAMPPDPTTMGLADANRIVAGGAGLGGPDDLALLGRVGASIGASLGATRVATDAGWTAPERQIGTTGVAVDPELYIALGISGAVQHVMGLGDPSHVISVNLDASCPMMAMADLAVVTDARALLPLLAEHLGAT